MKRILILILLFPLLCTSQEVINPYVFGTTTITAPSFISSTNTSAFNTTTTPKATGNIAVNSGDMIVAIGICSHSADGTFAMSVSNTADAGGALTWTNQQEVSETNQTAVAVWTATAGTTTNVNVSFANSSTQQFGGIVYVFRGSGGVGASNKAFTLTNGAPSVTLTTLQDHSSVVFASADWLIVSGSTRTWATINSITPSTGGPVLERLYQQISGQMTIYSAYWNDVGTAGSKSPGITSPNNQRYSSIAIEIKGQ